MKIKPLITEKSMTQSKEGKYTFLVDKSMTKGRLKEVIGKLFKVHVVGISTINLKSRTKKSLYGKKVGIKAQKKAIVTLSGNEKIDLFEVKESKK